MSNTKIMVVDHDEKILFAFQQVLKKEGYGCIVAKTAANAVEKFEFEHPRMVFLDMILPDVNGLALLRRIKQIDKSIPVIIISGHKTAENEMKAWKLGALEFLSKPLSVAKIREIIHKTVPNLNRMNMESSLSGSSGFSESKEKVLNRFEKQFISKQLAKHNGNITAAAKDSKMSRQNFYRLLIKHQIKTN